MFDPAFTGSGASAFEMFSVGDELIVVVIAAPAVGGVSFEMRIKSGLVRTVPFGSGLLVLTTSCTELEAAADSPTMFQFATPAPSVPPPVADTNEVLAGIVSAMTTPVALAFPVFEYDSV